QRRELFIDCMKKFCDIYVEYPEIVGESLENVTTFTDIVSKHLASTIKSIVIPGSQAETSKAIMRMFASKQQLFYPLMALNLLCNGPNYLLETMKENELPAILIRTYSSFTTLPSHPSWNLIELYRGGTERVIQGVAPAGVVADILTDILVHFVTKSSVLKYYMEKDILFLLVKMILDAEDDPSKNKEEYFWQDKALEILTELFSSDAVNGALVTYFEKKDIIAKLIEVVSDGIDKDRNKCVASQKQLLAASLLIESIQGTVEASTIFLDKFVELSGYDMFYRLLILPPYEGKSLSVKGAFIGFVEDLAFAGVDDSSLMVSTTSPYQHDDFTLPESQQDNGTLVRNAAAMQILTSIVLYPEQSFNKREPVDTSYALPDSYRMKAVAAVAEVLKANPSNFFLTESLNFLPTFIEQLDRFSSDLKAAIVDLLIYVMVELNYVPFRELIVLSLHFQGHSSKDTTATVCHAVISLLRTSHKFQDMFREIGLLNMLCNLIQELAVTLKDRFGDTHFQRRISISNISDITSNQKEIDKRNSRFSPDVVDNFQLISECLVDLLRGNKTNISLFGTTYKGNLFDLLHYDETRAGALATFEVLVVDGHRLSTAETSTSQLTSRSSVSSTSAVEHSFQFGRLIEIVQTLNRFDLNMKIHILLSMKRILVACPAMKDVFRDAGGFVCLVSLLVSLEDVYDQLAKQDAGMKRNNISIGEELPTKQQTVDTLRAIFVVFAEALLGHEYNRRFFCESIGFKSVEDAIRLTNILGPQGSAENLFGILFGFAIVNESLSNIFIERTAVDDRPPEHKSRDDPRDSRIIEAFGNITDEIQNPEVIPTILRLQSFVRYNEQLTHNIYEALLALAFANRRNQVSMNQCGVLEIVLRRLFYTSETVIEGGREVVFEPNAKERLMLTRLAQRLIEMGVSTIEIRFLFEQLENGQQKSENIFVDVDGSPMSLMDMVLYGVQRSRWPRFVQFDMNPVGFSCLEMSRLTDRQFPPSSGGYCFMTWLDIENFDPLINLIILGLSDDEKKCYLHVFIDTQSKKLTVQTSPKHAVRLEGFEFRSGCWYHIALVHHRPRLASASTLSLYVDGKFVEVVRCPYLGQPAPNKAIRTFLGTPPDVARQLGKTNSTLAWDMGPTYLFEEDVDGDVISVFYHLGPRYTANFQASLGQFQTYQTSTLLNMRIDALSHKRKDMGTELDNLAMVNAIRGNNSQTLPEEKIVFAFSAGNILISGQNLGITGAGLSESTIQTLTIGSVNRKLIINAAVPKIERALRVGHGTAYLKGDPIIATPHGMDDSVWKIGGSAVVLRLIERAETTKELYKAVCILIELIRFSWRNSEDMERIHGYEILAYLLRQKQELLTLEILNVLLVFVGLNPVNPADSVIINPLAYRYLMLDFELWKNADEVVQKAHLQQFATFIQLSQHHQFNAKRLNKMHVVKKMLVALKINVYSNELLNEFIAILKIVIKHNFTTEVVRSIATFLVSSLNRPSPTRRNTRRDPLLKRSATVSVHKASDTSRALPKTIITNVKTLEAEVPARKVGNLLMEMLADIICDKLNPFFANKFSVTITNKWPLLFFDEASNPFWVVCAARILARLFYTQGPNYISKFRTSSDGFIVMQRLLPKWWYLTQLQQALFAMLFGIDICDIPMEAPFDLFTLLTQFGPKANRSGGQTVIICADIMPTILLIMKEGVNTVVRLSQEAEKDMNARGRTRDDTAIQKDKREEKMRKRQSRSLTREFEAVMGKMSGFLAAEREREAGKESLSKLSHVEQTLVHFLADMNSNSHEFSEFCSRNEILDGLIDILFPIVCASEELPIESELFSKDMSLSFGVDVSLEGSNIYSLIPILSNIRQPKTNNDEPGEEMTTFSSGTQLLMTAEPINVDSLGIPFSTSPMTSDVEEVSKPQPRRKSTRDSIKKESDYTALKNATVEGLLEFVVSICVNSIVDVKAKSLSALETVFKSFPPASLDNQIHFASYVFNHVIGSLKSTLQLDRNLLLDSRIVTNTAKFIHLAVDAIYQGWFVNGRNQILDFITIVLENIQRLDDASGRVRVNDTTITAIYRSLNRVVLFRMAGIDNASGDSMHINDLLEKIMYHQKVIFSHHNTDIDFLKSICYHLYKCLLHEDQNVKRTSMSVWKLLMLQKPVEMSGILKTRIKGIEYKELVEGFAKLLETKELNSFLEWIGTRREQLDALFLDNIYKTWENIITSEVKTGRDTIKNSHTKRMTKLKRLYRKSSSELDFFNQYRVKTNQWAKNIQELETSRYYKNLQDHVDHDNYVRAEWSKTSADLFRERALWSSKTDEGNVRWRLDFTEGKCRMRKKLETNDEIQIYSYKPKSSKNADDANKSKPSNLTTINTSKVTRFSKKQTLDVPQSRSKRGKVSIERKMTLTPRPSDLENTPAQRTKADESEEDEDEDDDETEFEEDKNRKVLRSLEHGDSVLDIFNISRIMGLDACEGLLLLCKQNLYLMDNYFQRSDGEIVDVWDAPTEERDQYLQMIASHASYGNQPGNNPKKDKHQSRRWAFEDIKEVHKRKFLFRDVALEIFFNDGRNYLITFNLKERDIAYSKLVARATFSISAAESVMGTTSIDAKTPVSPLQIGPTTGLMSIFPNFFANSSLTELTQRWERREISNFQYLMHLNTLAGRSYNDLTQYPVFPWILADYTSEEFDLTKPETFRDFSKPMGAQTQERQKEFQIRYRSWDPTINGTTPAFHYGTHYSSAMIVCSYLIRLEPFTQQYLKLQGGHFDHADRLFHSIGKAWLSASRENMSDVRELIPEFFYLPEFLENTNKFNFGVKQASGEVIDSVILPPWAKGDPRVFIHKHREALECDYISAHLNEWIDLAFGYKQQGQAAIDAVNVFHHLSYDGAVDLDSITDPVERSASTGIIHNFGQTPRQLFTKPHPPRLPETSDSASGNGLYSLYEHVDKLIQSITPVQDIRLQVHDIRLSNDRLVSVSTQKILVPPNYNYYIEWGYADNSLRLHQTDTKRMVGLYENLHLETISCASFADGQTFVTGGTDAVVCIWRFNWQSKTARLHFLECLRGHSAKVNCFATSRSYSIIVSGSDDKSCIIWDLNRMKYVRQLKGHETGVQYIAINDTTGDIATCSGSTIRIWGINGDLIVTKSISSVSGPITCCTFYEGKSNEWFIHDMILTGHKKGIIKVWHRKLEEKIENDKKVWRWDLMPRHHLQHESRLGMIQPGDVTVLHASGTQRTLYSGCSNGKVFAWVLPDAKSDGHWMPDSATDNCLKCGMKFAVLA
ncbi:7035_t:CDS:10, partial [Paraglomus brasilianum]